VERCCISFGWTTGGSRRTWPGTAKRRCAAGLPGRFAHRSIVAWLARKDGISQRQARQLIDDYLAILESGALLGHRGEDRARSTPRRTGSPDALQPAVQGSRAAVEDLSRFGRSGARAGPAGCYE
jgi:hypothetical protein